MRRRAVPEGCPRYGLLLDDSGEVLGVILTIYARVDVGGRIITRCNLSSWYTEPSCGPYASLLLNAALKVRDVTYVNISPAPHTQPIIEAQGFRSFCPGSFLHFPALAAPPILAAAMSRPQVRGAVRPLTLMDAADLPEREMLEDHLALGCLCFRVDGNPFVFAPVWRIRRMLPSTYLLYCRSIETYRRSARELGFALLRRGALAVLMSTESDIPGLRGRQINLGQNKYVFGSDTPRAGDLLYTELAVFGG